jgi:UDP-glucose 4-epimerase
MSDRHQRHAATSSREKPARTRRAAQRRVLVTHADTPLGQRLVKRLFHDPAVALIHALGDDPAPGAFDWFLAAADARFRYSQVDLTDFESVSKLFRSAPLYEEDIDAVVHVPRHGPADASLRRTPTNATDRTTEARAVLQQCLQSPSIHGLVALGSAFVYHLPPGNANHLDEDNPLDLDPDAPAEIRSWVDCDVIFRGEANNTKLRVVLLRLATVVGSGGSVFLNPVLESTGARVGLLGSTPHLRSLGFDPICALVSDKDAVRAAHLALHSECSGAFNIAGREAVPLSHLTRWTGRVSLALPGPLLGPTSTLAHALGLRRLSLPPNGPSLRHGFTLDMRRAEAELGYRPRYRIRPSHRLGTAPAGDSGPRIEATPV